MDGHVGNLHRMRITLLFAALVSLSAAVLWHQSAVEARLLRADPNSLPKDPTLMAFAGRVIPGVAFRT
jgi:hypothetical protein